MSKTIPTDYVFQSAKHPGQMLVVGRGEFLTSGTIKPLTGRKTFHSLQLELIADGTRHSFFSHDMITQVMDAVAGRNLNTVYTIDKPGLTLRAPLAASIGVHRRLQTKSGRPAYSLWEAKRYTIEKSQVQGQRRSVRLRQPRRTTTNV